MHLVLLPVVVVGVVVQEWPSSGFVVNLLDDKAVPTNWYQMIVEKKKKMVMMIYRT